MRCNPRPALTASSGQNTHFSVETRPRIFLDAARALSKIERTRKACLPIIMLERIAKNLDHATPWQVFAIAFVLSVLCAMFASVQSHTVIGGEGHDGYLELAQNLVAGNGYVFAPNEHKVFHRPPTYPLLLVPGAALPQSFLHGYIILLNSGLFAGTVALVFSFATKFFSQRVAGAAALLVFADPFLLYGLKNPVSAVCQMFLFTWVVVLSWRFSQSPPTVPRILVYILVLYAAIMSHGTMLPIAFLLLVFFLARAHKKLPGPSLSQVFSIGIALVLFIAPWTYRNYKVTGLVIPISGNTGVAYFAGNAHWGITLPPRGFYEDRADSEFRHAGLPVERRRELMKYYGMAAPSFERLINQRAKEHLRAHPLDFARKVALNAIEYYLPIVFYIVPPGGSALDGMSFTQRIKISPAETLPLSAYYLVLVTSAAFGFKHLLRDPQRRGLAYFLLALWIVYAALYFPFLVFVGHSLYTYGTLPIVSIFAAVFWSKRFAR